ncbi:MAG: LuxR C-terminal-related transcriptional regulator [Thermodesulfobacteriota bacterium]
MARKLGSSEKTVKAHITSIFEKLGLNNRYQLIVYGKRNMSAEDVEI